MAAIVSYYNKLFRVCTDRGFWLKPLGSVDDYITWLIMTKKPFDQDSTAKRLLVVAGTHGEEQAGPLAILHWLQECKDPLLSAVNISFIPIINGYGFVNKKRYGLSDIPTNGGFGSNKTQDPSPEGQVLVNNLGILRPLAEDGFMSLHEDVTIRESYIYTIEKSPEPTQFTRTLRRELSKHFPKAYDGIAWESTEKISGPICKKGIVYNHIDESLEALMFQLGVPCCAVPETPGKAKLKKRVEAHVAMITKFVELCIKE